MNRDDVITVLALRARKSGSGALRDLPRSEIEWLVEPLLRGIGLGLPADPPVVSGDNASRVVLRP